MESGSELILFKSNGAEGLSREDSGNVSRTVHILMKLFGEALQQGATDIHMEPEADRVVVRFRVDGFLRSVAAYDLDLGRHLVSCVKTLCDLDITRKYGFQDGSFYAVRLGRKIDFRVSCVEEVAGEKLMVRILPTDMDRGLIGTLGMDAEDVTTLRAFSRRTQGTLLATGPTGAGKTTTLYAILQEIDRERRNVVSIEDPVEYHLPLMTQVHADTKQGMEFGTVLRSMLRQDPNVIMVGEVRDRETAETALQAALTGHLILTTTHSKDAIGAVYRLLDLGIPAYQLASALDLVLAQRLARKLCEKCRQPLDADPRYFEMIGFPAPSVPVVYRAQGCSECGDTGYRGRTGVFELLRINDAMRDAILRGASEPEMQALMNAVCRLRMRADAMRKVEAGILSMEEVARVLT